MDLLAIASPLQLAGALCALVTLYCWAAAEYTGNFSQVDRLWSVLPPIYIGCFAAYAGFRDLRLDLMMLLTAAWGARLTYNFARKGGYRAGSEDYRWPVLRQRMSKTAFRLFNATFIAPFQNGLLLLLALPAYLGLGQRAPLTWLDGAAALGFVAFLVGETVADQQQWDFHAAKHAAQARGEVVDPPFLTTGLFRYSRHPNFFCEQGMWWCVYLFSVAAGGAPLNYSVLGAVVLTLLFQGSTRMTEALTLAKYPSYAAYQRRTSRLIPAPPSAA